MPGMSELLNNKKPRVYQGDGYLVQMYFPHGVRYLEGDRSLTLWSELLRVNPGSGEKFWVFFRRRWHRGVYVPTVLKWDDGSGCDPDCSSVIISRLETAMKVIEGSYELVPTNESWPV